MKKYLSLIGIALLILIIALLWYQSLFSYLAEHTYYFWMLSSGQNRRVVITALLCTALPIIYLLASSRPNINGIIIFFLAWAWIFGVIHSNIKWNPIWFGQIITLFNTLLLVCLWIYLILGFSAVWSRVERKLVKFNQLRWQEIFLSFWIWFCSFIIIVQILLWIWFLYGIVSWLLFLWLGFMIRYERENLKKWWEIIWDILNNYQKWILSSGTWKRIWFLATLLPVILSVAYLYMWIQNSFVPYSTAWDANHEYMYIPKILAENHWVYWWNTVANTMPGFWHQFLTFIFSLTGCTNWWFGLSPDNIAISMNNMSATFVLIFWIAIIFQIFTLINDKKEKNIEEKSELKKWKNTVSEAELSNWNWITMGRYMLLLWLTSGMWAFLVIVDNKTDLWVMALSLLALLAGLIFLQNRKNNEWKWIIKYVIIAWLFFGFAALAKITAFVDFVLFGLLLVWLWFSWITSLGLGLMAMWFVRKFNVLTSSVMLTDETAAHLITIWGFITALWLLIYLLNSTNRKEFWKNLRDLIIIWIWFLLPLIVLKLPRATINQIKTDNYSIWNSLKAVFLSADTSNKKDKTFLAQNTETDEIYASTISDYDSIESIEEQNTIDISNLNSRDDKSFTQCSSAWDIYSEDELNEWLQELNGWWGGEDLWRYIWYGWKQFTKNNTFTYNRQWTWDRNVARFFMALRPKSNECEWATNAANTICNDNLAFNLMKLLWPSSETCYGFNHDAKILCENAEVINQFKIDDLRAIYENWIDDKDWEAWLLLKQAIDAYDKAKSEWKIWFSTSNTTLFHDEIVNLRQYYQSNSIASTTWAIAISYKYLVPLNIAFNWSLQNLSSYYTDIGFFWIIVYVFLLIALPYAIVKRDKMLTSIALTTLIWWWIRWIIWSSILRYGTVLISWTMITLAVFWDRLLEKDKNPSKILPRILIILVWIIFWIQILFNFLRIASQWANSVFVWYKWNVWQQQTIDDNLNPYRENWNSIFKKVYGYWWKNIFDLQFPQYNPIINALANRKNEDWVIIAGTYIQYFLWNQWNIKSDWMLTEFWKMSSDWDLCKLYRRLKKDNTRYLIIDPNIGTVTMWEWNETLFYRFFAKLNGDKTNIEKDWTITTLIRLAKNGYLKLLSTNNLWTKYALTVDDETIRNYFWPDLTDEQLILTRSKMAVLQYFEDANSLFWWIAWIFLSRIMNDPQAWIEDIANIYWIEVDGKKLSDIAIKYINGQVSNWFAKDLTQEEKTVLITYINLYLWYRNWWEEQISSQIQSLLINSVTWWSQVIALELN